MSRSAFAPGGELRGDAAPLMPGRWRGDVESGAAHAQGAAERLRPGARDRGGRRRGDSMTGNGDNRRTAREEDVRPDPEGTLQPAAKEVPWLFRHKVGLPDAIEGYVERPELEERCALLERRLTVLHAPGGFGKTALLARCCRALHGQGIVVAWLSLDEEDGPGSLATHLAHAFEEAGLATFGPAGERGAGTAAPDPQADSQAAYRIELLLRAIAHHGAPCVLALDEVDRLRSPEGRRRDQRVAGARTGQPPCRDGVPGTAGGAGDRQVRARRKGGDGDGRRAAVLEAGRRAVLR